MQDLNQLPKPEISSSTPIGGQNYNLEEIWKIVLENARLYISPKDFNAWIKPVKLEKIENGIAEISCDQMYAREWIETNHKALLRRAFLTATDQNLELAITIRSSVRRSKPAQDEDYSQEQTEQRDIFTQGDENKREAKLRSAQINPKYLFSNFIVGAHNRLAHAVAEAVATDLGTAYNPVFFYGPTGVGKTHLMQAIGNEAFKNGKKVVYVSIEQFLNELIDAIRTKSGDAFRKKYRAIDLLIIDDVQFMETYPKTQEELFHTFNALHQANKQIVLASDRPPREINNITDRLRSRFEGGMVADIQAPDFETRCAILKQLTEQAGVQFEHEIIEMIAKNIESNVRELEGAVTKITSLRRIGAEITHEEVAKMLQVDIESKRKRIKPEMILKVVAEVFDVTAKEIKGSRRTAYVALARQVCMYLLREELGLPLEKVAREVNRKDHTTVLHACEKVGEMINSNERVKIKVEKCKEMLG